MPEATGRLTPQPTQSDSLPATAAATADSRATETPQAGWVRLADAPDAGAVWAPDSAHLLVWTATPGAPPESYVVRLLSRSGEQLQQFEQVADPVWVDSDRFVVYRLDWRQDESGAWYSETGPQGERLGTALMGDVGTSELIQVDLPLGAALSNGRGVVAVVRFDGGQAAEYAVWSDGELSEWRPGYPTAWSASGDRLLVVHAREAGPGAEGWLEVVESAGLSTLWASDESLRVGTAAFDPTGAYLAYPEHVERPRRPREVPEFDLTIRVVDLSSGVVDGFPAQENGMFAWTGFGDIVVIGQRTGQATVYDRLGTVGGSFTPSGPTVSVSRDGSTVLFYDGEDDSPTFEVQRSRHTSLIACPGTLAGPAPLLAPDGRGLVVVVRLPSGAPQGPPATVLVHEL